MLFHHSSIIFWSSNYNCLPIDTYRLDYQSRPHVRGAYALRNLVAKLPARAHSIYYRDEIGNISTSNVWSDSAKVRFASLKEMSSFGFLLYNHSVKMQTLLEIEPRYPMFGGWRTAFTIGYGLPLRDFLFQSQGKRLLNISFGCPMSDIVIENLIVKVMIFRDVTVRV